MPEDRELTLTNRLDDRLGGELEPGPAAQAVLRDLSALVCEFPEGLDTHRLLLMAAERREQFAPWQQVLDDLLREVGLFPYLKPETLGLADLLAYEAHRPEGVGDGFVMHHAQATVLRHLLDGENVALSAPTSFGKSLLIDAAIAAKGPERVAVIVPHSRTHRRNPSEADRPFPGAVHGRDPPGATETGGASDLRLDAGTSLGGGIVARYGLRRNR